MGSNLVLAEVQKKFGDRMVLAGVSVSVVPGEAVALVGPSGSGKSTLLNIIGSLEAPDAGQVCFGDTDVPALRGRELEEYRNRQIGFLFQEHHLLPQLTALENALVPTLGRSAPGAFERAKALLSSLGLAERANQFPATLSGGERQRTALARALVNDPPLLLCDEPTGSLDQAAGDSLIDLLLRLAHEENRIVLAVTHNLDQARRFDRILTLRDGRVE